MTNTAQQPDDNVVQFPRRDHSFVYRIIGDRCLNITTRLAWLLTVYSAEKGYSYAGRKALVAVLRTDDTQFYDSVNQLIALGLFRKSREPGASPHYHPVLVDGEEYEEFVVRVKRDPRLDIRVRLHWLIHDLTENGERVEIVGAPAGWTDDPMAIRSARRRMVPPNPKDEAEEKAGDSTEEPEEEKPAPKPNPVNRNPRPEPIYHFTVSRWPGRGYGCVFERREPDPVSGQEVGDKWAGSGPRNRNNNREERGEELDAYASRRARGRASSTSADRGDGDEAVASARGEAPAGSGDRKEGMGDDRPERPAPGDGPRVTARPRPRPRPGDDRVVYWSDAHRKYRLRDRYLAMNGDVSASAFGMVCRHLTLDKVEDVLDEIGDDGDQFLTVAYRVAGAPPDWGGGRKGRAS